MKIGQMNNESLMSPTPIKFYLKFYLQNWLNEYGRVGINIKYDNMHYLWFADDYVITVKMKMMLPI
jgi:hypothetical protein